MNERREGRNKFTPNGSKWDSLILVCSKWQPFRPLTTSNILHHLFIKHLTSTFFIPWNEVFACCLSTLHFSFHSFRIFSPRVEAWSNPGLNSKTKFHKDSIFQSVFPRKGYLLHYRKDHWAASSYLMTALVYKFTTYCTWEFYYYIR